MCRRIDRRKDVPTIEQGSWSALLWSHPIFYRFSFVIVLFMMFIIFPENVESSNVLFFNGMGEGSHFAAAAVIGEELASRDHHVTFIVSEEFKHLTENSKLKLNFEFIIINTGVLMTPYYVQITQAQFEGVDLYQNKTFTDEVDEARAKECSVIFSSQFIEMLGNRKFDAIVFDPWWPCCIALGDTLGTKKVVLNPASFSPAFLRAFGLHVNSALIAEQGTGFPENMNFLQRIQNVLISLKIPVVDHASFNDALATHENEPFVAMLAKNKITSYMEGLSSADLFISTSDPLLYPNLLETAGHVSVAGLTTKKAQPLPGDLETFMQSSGDHGVIILSLGTYVTHLPEKFVKIFRELFSKLPHKVIWHWKEGKNPSNMTENVRLMNWLPQNDLLGNDKTRLLIYQGGNNGLHEAIYHAVPLLVIPLGGDQFDVAQRVVDKEIGLKIDVTSVTVESLHNAITTLLVHPKYQRNIHKLSAMFRDRPTSPRQKAAYWIEHILKYGSEHFHSSSRELHNWQRNLIDVYLFILFSPCCAIIACIFVSKVILNVFWPRKRKID